MSVADPVYSMYLWLVIIGALGAFLFGYGTGSNDVANAFGTSVGARTLTLRQAVIIAAIFEFLGAMLLGRVSTATIAGGIASVSEFAGRPEVYMYGMVVALYVSGAWQVLASYLELNVSATHSIIGSIMGFALVWGGGSAVKWAEPDKGSFPPYKGVVPIIFTWFASPILTGLVAAGMFVTIRTFVLRRPNAYQLSFYLLPFLVLITVFISIFFVFTKGAKKSLSGEAWTDAQSAWVSALIAVGCALATAALILPLLHHNAKRRFAHGQPLMNVDGTLEMRIPKDIEAVPIKKVTPTTSEPSGASSSTEPLRGGSPDIPENASPEDTIHEAAVATAAGNPVLLRDMEGNLLTAPVHHHIMTQEERETAIAEAIANAIKNKRLKEEKRHARLEEKYRKEMEKRLHQATSSASSAASTDLSGKTDRSLGKSTVEVIKKVLHKTRKALLYGTEVDIHEVVDEDPLIAAIHANAEKFDPKVEFSFSYLQVFSAICVVTAHGGGEVGYAVGPLATIWQVYTEGKLTGTVVAPIWVILIGAAGLVIGLATYGYKVTRAMGVRMSKLSPTRGFCAELATALVILLCSQYGLPTSSSQCIVGAIVGVGSLEGRLGVNWKFFARQFGSWVATLFVSGGLTAALFAQGIYAPSKFNFK